MAVKLIQLYMALWWTGSLSRVQLASHPVTAEGTGMSRKNKCMVSYEISFATWSLSWNTSLVFYIVNGNKFNLIYTVFVGKTHFSL